VIMEGTTLSELDKQIEFIETWSRLSRMALELAIARANKGFADLEVSLTSLKEKREKLAKEEPAPVIQ